jgi:Putative outer membrane beta-barrel porin, MtrB/PioB
MRMIRYPTILGLLAFLFAPTLLFGQEQPPPEPEKPARGSVEFGFRVLTGDEDGRPELPFKPDVLTSKFNEYGDRRNGFVVPRVRMTFDDVLGSKNYVSFQSQSAVYKNQSYLATFGRYGKFKFQFRYDEIPHIYTNTARTLYVQTSQGVFTILPATKMDLQNRSSTICAVANCTGAQINLSLPSFIAAQVATEPFLVPEIRRKAGTGLVTWNITENWDVTFLFMRENEVGTRPIGLVFNSSPSASANSLPTGVFNQQSPGTGAELPEPIDYFNNTVRVMTEYGKRDWGFQVGYTGSFFHNNIDSLLFDDPFATADVAVKIIPKGVSGCPAAATANCTIGAVPGRGQMALYPDNHAQYLNFAAAFDLGKYVRVMGTANPGWLRQNEPFLPYSANSQIFFPDSTGALTIPATTLSLLPARSLNGRTQTLAMNYTAVFTPVKNVELKVAYRHYDFNQDTAVFTLTPILGDTIGANAASTAQFTPGTAGVTSGSGSTQDTMGRSNPSYNRKNLELSGDWAFAKRSALQLGYEGEWMDRSHRDAAHTLESSFFGDVDYSPWKQLLVRISGRHQNREPDKYVDDNSASIDCNPAALAAAATAGIFPTDDPCNRRFDEAARLLSRFDSLVQFNAEKLTVSGGFQTIQQDFNRRGVGSNSPDPLNFLTGSAATAGPYFLYGALKDLSYIYTFDSTYAISPEVSLFAEYTHERYHKRMISRNRSPFNSAAPFCSAGGCDSANNDWESTYGDLFDTYSTGVDLYLGKKVYLTTYYSLSAGKGNVFSRALGTNAAPFNNSGTNADKFVLVGSSAALPYPETTTRIHELSVIFKYKLRANLTPKLEYRFQQFDNHDYQTSAMTPYMGCVSPVSGTAVTGCPARQLIGSTSIAPTFTPSTFFPGFVVGDTSAARYIFLGVDQPSYRVHVITATLEYRF